MLYLPKFKAVEPNNLTGLRNGHILAQNVTDTEKVKTVKYGDQDYIENGVIVGLGKSGKVEGYTQADHDVLFLHFTEELNTYFDSLDQFAVEVVKDATYLRCIALYVGDTFTTNNYDEGTIAGAETGYAKVGEKGVLTLQNEADNESAFIVKKGTMPDGSVGYEFQYYKKPTATV